MIWEMIYGQNSTPYTLYTREATEQNHNQNHVHPKKFCNKNDFKYVYAIHMQYEDCMKYTYILLHIYIYIIETILCLYYDVLYIILQ